MNTNVSKKIDALLKMNGENRAGFSRHINVTQQTTAKKAKTQAWNIKDLLNLAEYTGTNLAFVDKNGDVLVKFEKSDLTNNVDVSD